MSSKGKKKAAKKAEKAEKRNKGGQQAPPESVWPANAPPDENGEGNMEDDMDALLNENDEEKDLESPATPHQDSAGVPADEPDKSMVEEPKEASVQEDPVKTKDAATEQPTEVLPEEPAKEEVAPRGPAHAAVQELTEPQPPVAETHTPQRENPAYHQQETTIQTKAEKKHVNMAETNGTAPANDKPQSQPEAPAAPDDSNETDQVTRLQAEVAIAKDEATKARAELGTKASEVARLTQELNDCKEQIRASKETKSTEPGQSELQERLEAALKKVSDLQKQLNERALEAETPISETSEKSGKSKRGRKAQYADGPAAMAASEARIQTLEKELAEARSSLQDKESENKTQKQVQVDQQQESVFEESNLIRGEMLISVLLCRFSKLEARLKHLFGDSWKTGTYFYRLVPFEVNGLTYSQLNWLATKQDIYSDAPPTLVNESTSSNPKSINVEEVQGGEDADDDGLLQHLSTIQKCQSVFYIIKLCCLIVPMCV